MTKPIPVYYCQEFLNHNTREHPENSNRLVAILNALEKDFLIGKVELRDPPYADKNDVLLNHDDDYFEKVRSLIERLGDGDFMNLDPDTVVSHGSFDAAMKAVGSGKAMLANYFELSKDEREGRAISLGRPPGHHALRNQAMGFCLFNNIAITAEMAIRDYGIQRVAILDWDVHHGNGTEASFFTDDRVLYLSTHQHPCFPGTGFPRDIGTGKGEGYNVNIPLPPGSGDSEMKYCFVKVLMPVLEQYNPQILLISAGYDAHKRDPLAWLNLNTPTYGWMAATLEAFCQERDIPILAFLEGGYDFQSLSESVSETMKAFSREITADKPDLSMTSEYVRANVNETRDALSSKWKF